MLFATSLPYQHGSLHFLPGALLIAVATALRSQHLDATGKSQRNHDSAVGPRHSRVDYAVGSESAGADAFGAVEDTPIKIGPRSISDSSSQSSKVGPVEVRMPLCVDAPNEASLMACLGAAIQKSNPITYLSGWNLTIYRPLTHETDYAGIFQSTSRPGECVLAFAGTKNSADFWETDYDYKVENLDRCGIEGVHNGFAERVNQFIEALDGSMSSLRDLLVDPASCGGGITVTGYSLGGAMASLVAACAGRDDSGLGFKVKAMYTFGTPGITKTPLANGTGCFHGKRFFVQQGFFQDPVPGILSWRFKHPMLDAESLSSGSSQEYPCGEDPDDDVAFGHTPSWTSKWPQKALHKANSYIGRLISAHMRTGTTSTTTIRPRRFFEESSPLEGLEGGNVESHAVDLGGDDDTTDGVADDFPLVSRRFVCCCKKKGCDEDGAPFPKHVGVLSKGSEEWCCKSKSKCSNLFGFTQRYTNIVGELDFGSDSLDTSTCQLKCPECTTGYRAVIKHRIASWTQVCKCVPDSDAGRILRGDNHLRLQHAIADADDLD